MIKELIKKATELGIQNAEALTASQLKKAIENVEKVQSEFEDLNLKATDLGIDPAGLTAEELSAAIVEAEAKIFAEENAAKISAALAEFLGVEDLNTLTPEELTTILAQKATTDAAEIETVVEEEGQTDEAFEALNGKEYVFAKEAPAAFRYLGQRRTQKEWLSDKDAMELMVAGKLSFLTLKK